jgi:hypothetical protein
VNTLHVIERSLIEEQQAGMRAVAATSTPRIATHKV